MRVGAQLHAPAALPPEKRRGTQCIGGCVGARADLDDLYSSKYYAGDQIKKNQMGEACSTYGGQERCIQDFGWET
jgi:hypothetical protein